MQITNCDEMMLEFEDGLNKRIDRLKYEYSIIRAGRANPKMLDKVMVDYYGTMTPISQTSNINVPEARMITITPWDMTMVKEISKAISASDLGVNPSDDGRMIRIAFPALTEERRKELVKDVKKYCEDCKIGIRNDRRDTIEKIKKQAKLDNASEDEVAGVEAEIQKLVDKYNSQADTVCQTKEKDILDI